MQTSWCSVVGIVAGSFHGCRNRARPEYDGGCQKENYTEQEAAGHAAGTRSGAKGASAAKSIERPPCCCAHCVIHGGGNIRASEPPRPSAGLFDKVSRHATTARQAAGAHIRRWPSVGVLL